MTVKETLVKARNELVTRGWTKRALLNEDGCVCALGAVGVAVVGEEVLEADRYQLFDVDSWATGIPGPKFNPEAYEAAAALAALIPKSSVETSVPCRIYFFNDSETITEADVLELFDRAIDAEDVKAAAAEQEATRAEEERLAQLDNIRRHILGSPLDELIAVGTALVFLGEGLIGTAEADPAVLKFIDEVADLAEELWERK